MNLCSRNILSINMDTSSDNTHISEGFAQSGHSNTHFRFQADEKPFACTFCSKTFSTSNKLKRHIRTHTAEKPFACTYCTQKCISSGILKIHIRTHTGEKPFACTYCTHKCIRSGSLMKHIRTHTGEKPFACTYCSKTFYSSDKLKIHIRTHTGEKPFACTYCEKKFCESGSLIKHIRIHTGEKPFACTCCSKTFSQSSHLKTHIHTHTGEKPFACTYCTQKCISSGILKIHIRTHTGEKPFTCTLCNKTFTQQSGLKTHMNRLHDSETGRNNFLRSSEVDCPDMKTDIQCEDQVLVLTQFKNGSSPVGNVLTVAALNCKEEILDETDCKPTVANDNQTTNDATTSQDVIISCGKSCEVKVKVEPLCDIQVESVRSISLAMFSHANEEIDDQVKTQSTSDLKHEVKTELIEIRQQENDDLTRLKDFELPHQHSDWKLAVNPVVELFSVSHPSMSSFQFYR